MALIEVFQEDFDSNSIDLVNKWTASNSGYAIANQRLEIEKPSVTNGTTTLTSKEKFDLTGSSCFCTIKGFRGGTPSAQAILQLTDLASTPSRFNWSIENGNILAQSVNAGTATTVLTISYLPDAHHWFRIRHAVASDTIYFETASVDAANPPLSSEWVHRGSIARAFAITSMAVRLHGGTYNTASVDPGTCRFDGINTAQTRKTGYGYLRYVGTSAAVVGTTGVTPSYPPDIIEGDLLVMLIASKYGNLPSTPGGWTLAGRHQGGIATAGADSGSPVQSIYTKEVASGETSSTTVSVTKATETGTVMVGAIAAFRRSAGTRWDTLRISKGADTTGANDWSVTGDVSYDVRENDLIFAASALNSDISTGKDHRVVVGGVTFGSAVELRDNGSSEGDDARLMAAIFYATTGEASAFPAYTFFAENKTVSTAPAGPTVMLQLRALEIVEINLDGSASVQASASGNLTNGILLAGAASVQATASANLTNGIVLGGAANVQAFTTGALTNVIRLAGAANVQAAATGALTNGIRLGGSAAAIVSASGDVKMQAELSGSVAASVSTGAPELDTAIAMQGAANLVASGSGNLITRIDMQGQGTAEAVATGELTTEITLTGAVAGEVTMAGELSAQIALAGSASGSVAASASLRVGVALDGAANVSAGASGALDTAIQLAGAAVVGMDAGATLTTLPQGLSADIAVATAASGDLTTGIAMQGVAGGTVAASGELTTGIELAGSAVMSAALVGGLLGGEINLAGAAAVSVVSAADLTTEISLAGASVASVTVPPATLDGFTALAGVAQWDTNGTGNLDTKINLNGLAEVGPFAVADLTIVPGSLIGAASMNMLSSGDLKMAAELSGAVVMSSTISGDIRNDTRLVGAAVVGTSAAASLATGIALGGAANVQTSTTPATLQTAISLRGAALATVDAGTPALDTAINMAGAAIGTAQASARLTTGIPLSGSAEVRTFGTGQLETAIGFAGHAGVSVSVPPAVLFAEIPLSGSAVVGVSVSRPELVRILRRIDEEFTGFQIDGAYNVFQIDPVNHPIEETP